MFYSNLGGNRVYDTNFRLRFLFIFLVGLVAFGSIVYWRSQLLFSQEYVDFPQYKVYHHSTALMEREQINEQD